VVEDAGGDHRVEPLVLLEVLKLDRAEDRAVRGRRVDRDDVVAGLVERPREVAVPTADLQYPRGASEADWLERTP
jgi:hypothetical protein